MIAVDTNVLVRLLTGDDPKQEAAALALAKHGVELADALHLSSRPPEATFVSFDKSFVQRARRARVSGISSISVRD
jgi:predicted nucleic acid-binding protein